MVEINCLFILQILMSVIAVFHAVKYAQILLVALGVVVIVDIQQMIQCVMVSDNTIHCS